MMLIKLLVNEPNIVSKHRNATNEQVDKDDILIYVLRQDLMCI